MLKPISLTGDFPANPQEITSDTRRDLAHQISEDFQRDFNKGSPLAQRLGDFAAAELGLSLPVFGRTRLGDVEVDNEGDPNLTVLLVHEQYRRPATLDTTTGYIGPALKISFEEPHITVTSGPGHTEIDLYKPPQLDKAQNGTFHTRRFGYDEIGALQETINTWNERANSRHTDLKEWDYALEA